MRLLTLLALGSLVYYGAEQNWYRLESETHQVCAISLPGETPLEALRRVAGRLGLYFSPKVETEIEGKYGRGVYRESKPVGCAMGERSFLAVGTEMR